ncbi:MAG: hypothetical protein RIE24_00595 [Silicimonas sp.]
MLSLSAGRHQHLDRCQRVSRKRQKELDIVRRRKPFIDLDGRADDTIEAAGAKCDLLQGGVEKNRGFTADNPVSVTDRFVTTDAKTIPALGFARPLVVGKDVQVCTSADLIFRQAQYPSVFRVDCREAKLVVITLIGHENRDRNEIDLMLQEGEFVKGGHCRKFRRKALQSLTLPKLTLTKG